MLTIYRYASITPRAIVEPDSSSQESGTLMGEETLTINTKVATPIQFAYRDYCYWFGKLYQINQPPKITANSTRDIDYSIVMESQLYELGKSDFLSLNPLNNFADAIFDFRGTAQDYADLIVYNLNRVFPLSNWAVGSVVDGILVNGIEQQYITQTFTAQNCLEAIKTIASLFQTEYFVEAIEGGVTVNIYQRQSVSGLVFSRGRGFPLKSITQDNQNNANLITRLRAFGSTKNIGQIVNTDGTVTYTYRDNSPRLRMPLIDYVEKNIDLYGIWEKTIIFDGQTTDPLTGNPLPEIYPHRTGTITAVDDYLNFYDDTIDFNLNDYLITGVSAQITFNTGLLSGYTFNISEFFYPTFKFTIDQDRSNPNIIVPTSLRTPQVGDEYVITNITMPTQYYTDAENQLLVAANDYISKYSIPPLQFSCVADPLWWGKNNPKFLLGQTVSLLEPIMLLNRTIRITSFQRNVRDPRIWAFTLSDTVPSNPILVKIINGL